MSMYQYLSIFLLDCKDFNQLLKKYFSTRFHYLIFEYISYYSILSYIKEASICYNYLPIILLFLYLVNVSIHFFLECKNFDKQKVFPDCMTFHDIFEHISPDSSLSNIITVVLYYKVYFLYIPVFICILTGFPGDTLCYLKEPFIFISNQALL